MKNLFLLIIIIWASFFCLLCPVVALSEEQLPAAVVETDGSGMPPPSPEEFISLKVPLLSPHFAETPVALVNEEPIPLRELARALSDPQKGTGKQAGERTKEYLSVLDRLIDTRLILLEAINIGLGETEAVRTQVQDFKLKAMLQKLVTLHLEGLEPDPADVEEVYQQISREVLLYSLTFESAADAQRFRDEATDGDFDQLAKRYVEEGKARGEKPEQYVKIKDLLPQIGQQAYSMEKGSVSSMFRTDEGFLLFQLTDSRFIEDEDVKKEAVKIILETLRKQKAMEYGNILTEKYVTFNEELYNNLDFNKDFAELKGDTRVIATVEGPEPVTITVGDLVAEVGSRSFHGADKAQSLQKLNKKKDITITNMLFKITGELEARHLGLDKTPEFTQKVEDFERSLLFNTFMQKVVLPDVKITAEEVRSYYDEHIDEFSSPAMLRMNSLVFTDLQDAENALDKLRKGADFKWVSANASGFVAPDTEGLLPFDEKLLSLTSLPEDLQESARKAQAGDALLYADPEGTFYYVLLMEKIFAQEPQPYEKARDAVAKIVYNQKTEQLLKEWTTKLKAGYETKIFLNDPEK